MLISGSYLGLSLLFKNSLKKKMFKGGNGDSSWGYDEGSFLVY